MQGYAGDAALLSLYDRSYPSPSPLLDDIRYSLLVTWGMKLLIGDGVKPENMQNPSVVFCTQDGQIVQATLRHPAFRAVQLDGEHTALHTLSLILVLQLDDFETLFIILKVFFSWYVRGESYVA